ncbi:HET-domain-containing protein, partial [Rhizodiscina lignyota]
FEMARFWLNDCLENHVECPKPTPFLPARVIDVGPPDGSKDPCLFEESLHDDELPSSERRYIALSHCWGPPPWFRTTNDTLDERRSSISMSDLPPTFRDAVVVTRMLNVRYLWIDSLCIIQGNKEDWAKEAVRMCDYYQNALCTITSAHSPSSHGGLFVQRDDLPLYKRAWVLQEMILSSRALIYDPDAVRWECLSKYGSEPIAHLNQNLDVMDIIGDSIEQRASGWQHIVEDYMGRGLTNESDRLIAMAGVAEAMQKHTSDVYIAGLWKNLLPYGLTW